MIVGMTSDTAGAPRYQGPTGPTGPTGSQTTGPSAPGTPPTGLDAFFDALRRSGVRRPTDDRWIGGVCAGTAHRLGVDPVLVRVAVVVLTLLGGFGIVAYAAAWLLLPDADGVGELERAARGDVTGTAVAAIAVVVAAVLLPGPWDVLRGEGPLVDGGDVVGAILVGTLLVVGLALLPRLGGRSGGGPDGAPTGDTPSAASPASPRTAGPAVPVMPRRVEPVPPRPRRQGPPAGLATGAVGVALVAAGATWLAAGQGVLDGRPGLLAGSAALLVLGATTVGLGVTGRTDGPVGGAAFVAVVATLAMLVVPSWSTTQLAGERTWRPATVSGAERGGSLGIGDGVLDLSALDGVEAGDAVEVPVRVGIGRLEVRVPEDVDVEVRGAAFVGGVTDRSATGSARDQSATTGVGVARTIGPRAALDDEPAIVVDARVLVGEVVVVRTAGP